MLLSGVVGILLGVYLWANMPVSSEWVLGVLLGIQLICEGAALAYLAWRCAAPRAEPLASRGERVEDALSVALGRRLDVARIDPADLRRGRDR